MNIYFVLRVQRGYNYDTAVDRSKLREDHNNNKTVHNEFLALWDSLFKKSYNQVRKEVKELTLQSVYRANFDRVYLNLDDFYEDYGGIVLKNDPDTYVFYMDDDDFVRSDVCSVIKTNYVAGFHGISWNYLRYHGIDNMIYSPNTQDFITKTGKKETGIFYSPWPHIQSNHCLIRIPIEPDCAFGSFLEEYNTLLPVNHSCMHKYLFQHNSNRKLYNIAQPLSLHNTTPASYSFYDNDYKTGGRLKDVFDDPRNFYNSLYSFVNEGPFGTLQLLADEWRDVIKQQKTIFEGCL